MTSHSHASKVFVIGLPRTGTTSLDKALQVLGYQTKHNPLSFRRLQFQSIYSFPGEWDALTNFGEHTYPQLDQTYPNSKFILTLRDKDKWLDSIGWKQKEKSENEIGNTVRIDTFGSYVFNAERWAYVYDLHCKKVVEYFSDRPDDFLIMNLDKGDGWEKLCAFLEADVPDMPFLHVHTRQEIEKKRIQDAEEKLRTGHIARYFKRFMKKIK